MGDFYSVAGFIELGHGELDALRSIIAENRDGIADPESWVIHPNGGWMSFAFYGNTIRPAAIEPFRTQLLRICKTITSVDDELDTVDHVEGRFLVRYVDIERPCREWILGNGELTERACGDKECLCSDRPRYE